MEALLSAMHLSRSTGLGFTLCRFQLPGEALPEERSDDALSERIEELVANQKRYNDVFLGRSSAGGFLVLFRNTDADTGAVACSRLGQAMARAAGSFRVDHATAQFPEDGDTTFKLLNKIGWTG